MNKAVFLDRDGTLCVDRHYLCRFEEFELLPGVPEALKLLKDAGFLLIVITNQSGIARGYYTEADFRDFTARMEEYLTGRGVSVDRVYYCPHHPDAAVPSLRRTCDCRKPKTGLFERAVRDFDLDLSACYAVGDRLRDCAVCRGTACRGYLVGRTEPESVIRAVSEGEIPGVSYAPSLYDAAVDVMKSI